MSGLEQTHDLTTETQDSQAYLETVKTELGFNGSLRFEQSGGEGETRHDATASESLPAIVQNSQLDDAVVPDTSSRSHVSDPKQFSTNTQAPEAILPQPSLPAYVEVPNSNEADTGARSNAAENGFVREDSRGRTPREQHAWELNPNRDPARGRPNRKMDASQESPTQVNEDRNYEVDGEVYDSLPSTYAKSHPQDTDTGDRTLQPDDTGAVNFENIHELPRPSSQVSEDGGFENTRGDWRNPDKTSQLLSSIYTPFKPQKPAFETPALPRNPFAAGSNAAVPLGGTQLFGQTQFSSAIKQVSPGSSRPSPNAPLLNLSPNVAETSPLKNRANVSSPTDVRSSSPPRLDEVPTTVRRDNNLGRIEEETPSASRSTGEEVVPESPTNKVPKLSAGRHPLAHYETMKKSQERKYQDEPEYVLGASDSESDSAVRDMERRRRLEQKRAQAAREMGSVSFTPRARPNSSDRPRVKRRKTDENPQVVNTSSLVMDAQVGSRSEEDVEPLVADSQQRPLPLKQLEADVSTQGDDEAPEPQVNVSEPREEEPTVTPDTVEDRILATSPIGADAMRRRSDPELPQLDTTMSRILDSSNDTGEPSSLPPLNRKTTSTYRAKSRPQRRRTILSSSATEAPTTPQPKTATRSSPPVQSLDSVRNQEELPEQANIQDKGKKDVVPSAASAADKQTPTISTSQRATRSRAKTTSPLTPLTNQPSDALATSSSTGELSSAPPSSTVTTPGTKDERQPEQTESVADVSPVAGDKLRKQAAPADETRVSPLVPARSLRASRRGVRYGSESTDELCPSSSASAMERSMVNPKRSYRQFRQSIGHTQRSNRLFGGMAFALSFQPNAKQQDRDRLEGQIVQAGGAILDDFEGLFEPSGVMDTTSPVFDVHEPLVLKSTCSDVGFTALIADSHSRKAKYMQALALGLPCIAHQWIDACLQADQILEWEHYLLCSGSSALLGNAIRSRILNPYSAAEARLADVVSNRPQLLHGQRILAVVDSRKRQSEAKRPYMFLAQALGSNVSRVFTTKQASEALTEHAKADKPFDWLYFDQGKDAIRAVMSSTTDSKAKKRKRATAPTIQPNLDDIRVLNDELIIQTLILGRVIQEHEMSSLSAS